MRKQLCILRAAEQGKAIKGIRSSGAAGREAGPVGSACEAKTSVARKNARRCPFARHATRALPSRLRGSTASQQVAPGSRSVAAPRANSERRTNGPASRRPDESLTRQSKRRQLARGTLFGARRRAHDRVARGSLCPSNGRGAKNTTERHRALFAPSSPPRAGSIITVSINYSSARLHYRTRTGNKKRDGESEAHPL